MQLQMAPASPRKGQKNNILSRGAAVLSHFIREASTPVRQLFSRRTNKSAREPEIKHRRRLSPTFTPFLPLPQRASRRTKAAEGQEERDWNARRHQRGSDAGSRRREFREVRGGRKRRQQACALGFLSEGLIAVCHRESSPPPRSLTRHFARLLSVPGLRAGTLQAVQTGRRSRRRRGRRLLVAAYQTSQFAQAGRVMTGVVGGGAGGHWGGLSLVNS